MAGQVGGRWEPVLHWARLTLFPRGRLGDGAWRDHVQEVLPLAVHRGGGLVHCQAWADKCKGPAYNRTEQHAEMAPVRQTAKRTPGSAGPTELGC